MASCKPSDVLSVPPPPNQFGTGVPSNQQDAEIAYSGAQVTLFRALDSYSKLLPLSSVMTDEFTATPLYSESDSRLTRATDLPVGAEESDDALGILAQARVSLLLATTALRRNEPDSGQWKVGEAFALVGYAELMIAEDYCAGMTLSDVPDAGGIVYGRPLTTDSTLGAAEAHFDSALAHAHGNTTVQALASVGLGRTRLNRGHAAQAATAVANVPTVFAYNVALPTSPDQGVGEGSLYVDLATGNYTGLPCGYLNVADREGVNGLNFVSAQDQRLVFDSTLRVSCDAHLFQLPDSVFYYPVKFGVPPTGLIPLATGVEARLIEAEGALSSNAVNTWAADLNALRAAAPSTYLAMASPMDPLTSDSTTGAGADMRVDVMFRERAFWLFGLGTRLGDLRRLIRNYHRDRETVFPTGPYTQRNNPGLDSPIPNYGTDVSFTLPTPASNTPVTNPYYKGCLSSPGTA